MAVWFLNILLSDQFVLMVVMFSIVGAAEYFFPAREIPRRHYRLNLGYAVVNVFAVGAIAPLLSGLTAYSFQKLGLGFINLAALGFGGLAGDLLVVLIGALIWDFFQYWAHRLQHASGVLWQMHLLHHSDEHMNMTTESRHHVLENVLAPVLISIPVAVLFHMPPVKIAALSLIPYAWNYLAHANLNLGFGVLWWLLVSPNYHRVHHALSPVHRDKNFANWFPLWDILFGTAVNPRGGLFPATGVDGVRVLTVAQAYLLPFRRWLRMLAPAETPPKRRRSEA